MQPLLAIVWLTLKAALRYRLALALAVALLAGVVLIPWFIKDDGTARGFTQIILTYTLSLITALLGFANLWLACGTLARDIEEAQIQMVVVKPIARWKIWLGKWLGILTLNAILITISGAAIYAVMTYRAGQLPAEQQKILRNEVLIARGSAMEPAENFDAQIDDLLQRAVQERPPTDQTDVGIIRQVIEQRVKASRQLVPSGYQRIWSIPFGSKKDSVQDKPLTLRVKFNVPDPTEGKKYLTVWDIGDPKGAFRHREEIMMPSDSYQEFVIPPKLLDPDGVLHVTLINPNEMPLLVPLEDGLEALYPEGGFALNFARGLGVIFCWLAALAAIGMFAASFLAFPVAAFCSLAILTLALSTGTLKQIVDEGGIMGVNHETGFTDNPVAMDRVAVPIAKAMLAVLNLARDFSPVEKLSSGRSISWGELTRAIFQMIVVMSGMLAAAGMFIFTRRELATAQTGH